MDVEEAFGDLIRGSSIVGAFLYDRQIKGGSPSHFRRIPSPRTGERLAVSKSRQIGEPGGGAFDGLSGFQQDER